MAGGFQLAPRAPEADVRALLALKPNIIRYQLHVDPWLPGPTEWLAALELEFIHLRATLEIVNEFRANCRVIIDMHRGPGGDYHRVTTPRQHLFDGGNWGYQALLSGWENIAIRFSGYRIGYGILNEPAGANGEVEALMRQAVQRIRYYDNTNPVVVTCPFGDPERFRWKVPLDEWNVWYEAHLYYPIRYTHQGLYAYPENIRYGNMRYNWEKMRKHMRHLANFKQRTGFQVFIGEMGCRVGSEGERMWWTDALHMVDRNDFHWCAHAWREANVWNYEQSPEIMHRITEGF